MALHVTHLQGGVLVSLTHAGETDLLRRVADQLGTGPATVIVDVAAITMAPSEGVELLVAQVRAAAAARRSHRWSLVAGRLTARRILRRLCAGSAVGVYPDIDTALAAGTVRP